MAVPPCGPFGTFPLVRKKLVERVKDSSQTREKIGSYRKGRGRKFQRSQVVASAGTVLGGKRKLSVSAQEKSPLKIEGKEPNVKKATGRREKISLFPKIEKKEGSLRKKRLHPSRTTKPPSYGEGRKFI